MKYCKKCLQPDTRPNTFFGDDGVCPACTYFEAIRDVDWIECSRYFARREAGQFLIVLRRGGQDSMTSIVG